MTPWILGAMSGIVLALANFFASIALSSRALRSSRIISIAFVLGAFFVRLVLLFLAFCFVARSEKIDLSSALLTFAVCFTVLLFWEVMIYYRKAQISDKVIRPKVRPG